MLGGGRAAERFGSVMLAVWNVAGGVGREDDGAGGESRMLVVSNHRVGGQGGVGRGGGVGGGGGGGVGWVECWWRAGGVVGVGVGWGVGVVVWWGGGEVRKEGGKGGGAWSYVCVGRVGVRVCVRPCGLVLVDGVEQI